MSTRQWMAWVISTAALGVMLYLLGSDEPKLPIAVANGSFANAGIGTLVLKNGRMTVSGQFIDYVIEIDKAGAYVLPKG